MADRILGRTVILTDDQTGQQHMYLAGEPVPADVAAKITNPAAWDTDDIDAEMGVDVNAATSAEVEGWVGGDPDRARTALASEQNREKGPRSQLVKHLEETAGLAG